MFKNFSITFFFIALLASPVFLYPQVPELIDSSVVQSENNKVNAEGLNFRFEKLQINKAKTPLFSFSEELNKKRLAAVLATDAVLIGTSIYGLNELWYKNYARSKFHLFDDSREWMQMDKLGHLEAAHIITAYGYYSFRWAGMEKKEAALYGSAVSLAYMTAIEVLDGYSTHWGFSLADMSANILGTAFFATQAYFFEERRVKLKISYHPTRYASYRPEVLGSTAAERIIKDYNGQTQWLSVSAGLVMPKSKKIPKWLCVSVGYGAEGMLGGFSNPERNEKGEALPTFERYRQFYLSFDVDFAQVKTNKKWVRGLLLALNVIKVPCPTLEYNTKGEFKFHYLYF